jgi:tetratricopeptide (TPR) repeat protein
LSAQTELSGHGPACRRKHRQPAPRPTEHRLNPTRQCTILVKNRRFTYYDRAIADYAEAIRLEPKNGRFVAAPCWERAMGNRDLQLALAECDAALRLQPNDPNTWDSRGFVHLRLNRLHGAIADYDAALKIDPKLASSLYGRGLAKLRKGDAAGGNADTAAAKAIKPDIAEEFASYGMK